MMAESSERGSEKQKRIRPLLSCTQCHARKIKVREAPPFPLPASSFAPPTLHMTPLMTRSLADLNAIGHRLTDRQCDRVKPCGACCLRGTPEQCSLDTSDDAQVSLLAMTARRYAHLEQSYISQANEIKRLRKQIADLELKVSREAGGSESAWPKSILPARTRQSPESATLGFHSSFVRDLAS